MVLRRTLYLLGASWSLLVGLLHPASAQFGVPKKPGTTFQEVQEQAKREMAAGGGGGLGGMDMDALANMDVDEMRKMIQEAMNDPKMMEAMGSIDRGVNDAMAELASMDQETLQKQMMEGLSMLTSGDVMDSVMQQKDEVLETLRQQGLVDESKLAEYRSDPELFEREMRDAFGQMKEVFSNPETLRAATQMMRGMSEVLADPQKAMRELAETMSDALGDDDKIEEARLQLLTDPGKAGSPLLAEMFGGEEMREILKDPVKWREQVKKGQGMLMGDEDGGGSGGGGVGAGQGAGVGEL